MASASQCPNFLWSELINTSNYLVNISPTRSNLGTIPDQLYYGTTPKVDHLRIFGSLCYLHVPKELRSKLDSKTKPCFFLGYDVQSKAYRVFDPHHQKIHISRDIIFDEDHVGYQHLRLPTSTLPDTILFLVSDYDSAPVSTNPAPSSLNTSSPCFPEPPSSPLQPDTTSNPLEPLEPSIPEPVEPYIQPASNPQIPPRRYPFHDRRPNIKFRDHYIFNTSTLYPNSDISCDPRHFYEAIQHPDWANAIQKEIDSVLENDT